MKNDSKILLHLSDAEMRSLQLISRKMGTRAAPEIVAQMVFTEGLRYSLGLWTKQVEDATVKPHARGAQAVGARPGQIRKAGRPERGPSLEGKTVIGATVCG